jgi:hypothetical protein
MSPGVLKARFDGREIKLDEPYDLPTNAKFRVTVRPTQLNDDMWQELSENGLARAYGDNGPDYPLSLVAEPPSE